MTRPIEPWRRGPWLKPWLALAALGYRFAWACLQALRPKKPQAMEVPVLSVGNLSVGGTGKSLVVQALARRALALRAAPAIVLRGYGARSGPRPLCVSSGGGPRFGAPQAGDEAVEHAQACACRVWVDADRARGARAAMDQGAEVLILDDGFQRRWQVARDLDLLLADYEELTAGERLLPAGPWREPWSQAALADAILVSGAPEGLRGEALREGLPKAWRSRHVYRLDRLPKRLEAWPGGKAQPLSRLWGRKVLALSGLGRPQAFEDSLGRLSGQAPLAWRFGDHHAFTPAELDRCPGGGDLIVTTAKDRARLPESWSPPLPVFVLRVEADISPARDFWRRVDAVLRSQPQERPA